MHYVTLETPKQSVESTGNKGTCTQCIRAAIKRPPGWREIRVMKLTQLDNVFSEHCFYSTSKHRFAIFEPGKIFRNVVKTITILSPFYCECFDVFRAKYVSTSIQWNLKSSLGYRINFRLSLALISPIAGNVRKRYYALRVTPFGNDAMQFLRF